MERNPVWITINDLARHAGHTTTWRIQKMVKNGELPAYRLGKRSVRVLVEDAVGAGVLGNEWAGYLREMPDAAYTERALRSKTPVSTVSIAYYLGISHSTATGLIKEGRVAAGAKGEALDDYIDTCVIDPASFKPYSRRVE